MAISEELQRRIAGFTGDMTAPTKGAISDQEMNMLSPTIPAVGTGTISDSEMQLLQQAEAESGAPFTAEEREIALAQIKKLEKQSQAPNFELTQQLAAMGTGDDTVIAHLEPGEVVLAPEFMEDPVFESAVEAKFKEFDIPLPHGTVDDPRGIISLDTGAQQFGFLKKVGKFLKKVVTPIAKVAQFVPGPWQVPAALISKAATVRDVVRGDANPLALLSVAGPTAVGGTFGENIAGLKAAGDGSILKGLGSLGGKTLSGIGNAVMNPMEAIRGIPSLLGSATMSGQPAPAMSQGQQNLMTAQKSLQAASQAALDAGDINQYNTLQTELQKYQNVPTKQSFLDKFLGRDSSSTGTATGGLGGLGGLAGLAGAGALAGTLGKLAYDEVKKDKGVQMTPLTSMDATGRYNIEAEIARRMGQQAPNPTEFGLLPANTFPELSGGKPMQARYGGEVMNYAGGGSPYPNKGLAALAQVAPEVVDRMGFNMGGQVMPMDYNMGGQTMMPMGYNMGGRPMMPMAYAEGGNVAMEDFARMNGNINGEGTETSDEIPAMLSDGEFVMTGQAVRGAGKYEMQAGEGGIMTLIPSLDEDRERGTNLMYSMMDAFAGQAMPSQEQA